MTRLSTNKDIGDLLTLAREQKWKTDRLGNGHIVWKNPEGEDIYTSSSPSDSRYSIVKIKHALKNAGLVVERADWQRLKRAQKAQEKEHDREMDELVTAVGNALIEGGYVEKGQTGPVIRDIFRGNDAEAEAGLVLLHRIIHPDTGLLDMRCPCGKALVHPQGYLRHVEKCPVFQETEGNVDRNVNAPPPVEQRLDCPDCGQWYWINQADHLERHMQAMHGKVKCYSCGQWLRERSMYRHAKSCTGAPEAQPTVDISDETLEQHQRDIAAASARAAQMEFTSPPHTVDDSRVGAIATPAELERLIHPPEPPPRPVKQPEPVVAPAAATNGVGHKTTGITERIREVMAEVGHIEIDDSVTDPRVTATGVLHELVGKEYDLKSLQSIVGQMARNGEIIREMASPRRTRSLTWAAASVPPEPPTRQAEEPAMPVSQPAPRASRPATVTNINRGPDVSDDDLWSLLEMVLDGPVQMNRTTYAIVNDWMEATRKLFQLKGQA